MGKESWMIVKVYVNRKVDMDHYGASKQTPITRPLAPWARPGEVEGGVLIGGLGY